MRRAILILATLAASYAAVSTAHATTANAWYWQPGFCKSQLNNYAMALGSGANAPRLAVVSSYCVGLHNRCWKPHGVREYQDFKVFFIAKDGAVRTFNLQVTGKFAWRGSPFKLLQRKMTLAQFINSYGSLAHNDAIHENALPCSDPTSPS
jgi:hypothetical protein